MFRYLVGCSLYRREYTEMHALKEAKQWGDRRLRAAKIFGVVDFRVQRTRVEGYFLEVIFITLSLLSLQKESHQPLPWLERRDPLALITRETITLIALVTFQA